MRKIISVLLLLALTFTSFVAFADEDVTTDNSTTTTTDNSTTTTIDNGTTTTTESIDNTSS